MFSPSLLSMRWADALFAHWAVDPAVVDERLPEGLSADTYDGDAYLGVVGFQMEDIRPRGAPIGRSFPELNLRTYVTGPKGPGIYFYNLDADDGLSVGVARRVFNLPYYRATMSVERSGDSIRLRSQRTHDGVPAADFDATYRPTGDPTPADPGTLDAFLTERYRFYVASDGGTLYAGPVEHPPWDLQSADLTIRGNDLFHANGFDHPGGDPLVHYSPGVDVRASLIRPVGSPLPIPS